jgi:protein-S-isoprenylcysteine O-methyltransferase Ste14
MLIRSLVTTAIMAVLVGSIIFLAAMTLDWWQAWTYVLLSFACNAAIVIDLALRDPELLRRRRRAGPRAEVSPVQKRIIRLLMLVWLLTPLLAGWDHRFGWSPMPQWTIVPGIALVLLGQAGIFWVFRANTYARATVEVSEGQTITDTGPYALVRHPMYTAMLLLSLAVPLALGSWWALAVAALSFPILAWRLADEEAVMLKELPGYGEYRMKVKSRLVPGIW